MDCDGNWYCSSLKMLPKNDIDCLLIVRILLLGLCPVAAWVWCRCQLQHRLASDEVLLFFQTAISANVTVYNKLCYFWVYVVRVTRGRCSWLTANVRHYIWPNCIWFQQHCHLLHVARTTVFCRPSDSELSCGISAFPLNFCGIRYWSMMDVCEAFWQKCQFSSATSKTRV